jgi:hypothetical protein
MLEYRFEYSIIFVIYLCDTEAKKNLTWSLDFFFIIFLFSMDTLFVCVRKHLNCK